MQLRQIAIIAALTGIGILAAAGNSSATTPQDPGHEPCPGDAYQCAGIVVGQQPSYGLGSGIGWPKPDPCDRFIEFC
jgi:hypothetical protein